MASVRPVILTGSLLLAVVVFLTAAKPSVAGAQAFPPDRAVSGTVAPQVLSAADTKTARPGGVRRTGLPLPRFASLRASKVNLRAGPGVRYPVEWVYQRRGLPVMITAEFDAWRRIRDWRGTVGWVHRAMLTGKRTVIAIGGDVVLRRAPSKASPAVARAQAGVIGRVLACDGAWCRIQAGGIKGWGQRRQFWGTLPKETIE
ncbi:MAG: SH3 domain-containing protein [Alphaproteobacteria bacterium]|nr:SH3 domain-containing protein [Alphaproteobacteria bacterium]